MGPCTVVREPTAMAEEDCSLDQLLAAGSGAAFYEYDFGDSWLHRLELVTRRPATKMIRRRGCSRADDAARWKIREAFWGTRRFRICSLTLLIRITSKYRNG